MIKTFKSIRMISIITPLVLVTPTAHAVQTLAPEHKSLKQFFHFGGHEKAKKKLTGLDHQIGNHLEQIKEFQTKANELRKNQHHADADYNTIVSRAHIKKIREIRHQANSNSSTKNYLKKAHLGEFPNFEKSTEEKLNHLEQ